MASVRKVLLSASILSLAVHDLVASACQQETATVLSEALVIEESGYRPPLYPWDEVHTIVRDGLKPVRRVKAGGLIQQRRRKSRSLVQFLPPGIIWTMVIIFDYVLWWRLIPGAAALGDACPNDAGGPTCNGRFTRSQFVSFHVLLALVLLSHISVMVADPGFVPAGAVQTFNNKWKSRRWCDTCRGFKPPRVHHCRICGACIARMDHHCIFASNCIGAGNHKPFLLLLMYSAMCVVVGATTCLGVLRCMLLGYPSIAAFLASPPDRADRIEDSISRASCAKTAALLGGTAIAFLIWISSILIVQCYGIAVDAGMVDRLQQAGKEAHHRTSANAFEVTVENGRDAALRKQPSLTVVQSLISSPAQDDNASNIGQDTVPHEKYPSLMSSALLSSMRTLKSAVRMGNRQLSDLNQRGRVLSKRWNMVREEILGEGQWFTWFVPSSAKLTPEVASRAYFGSVDCDENSIKDGST